MRPMDVSHLIGSYAKAERELSWRPRTDFEGLVAVMVEADLDKWRRRLRGEVFPWDAPNYRTEAAALTRTMRM